MIVKCGPRRPSASRILYLTALDLPESFFNGIMRIEILCKRDTIKLPLHLKKGSAVGCKYFIRKSKIFLILHTFPWFYRRICLRRKEKKKKHREITILPLSYISFPGPSERIYTLDGSSGSAATQGEEPAGEPAPSAERDRLESRVAGDDERDASVMLGPPSEASRPRCPHGVDLTLGRFAANLSAGGPKVAANSSTGRRRISRGTWAADERRGVLGGEIPHRWRGGGSSQDCVYRARERERENAYEI